MNTELHGFSKQWEHEAMEPLGSPGVPMPHAWTTEEAGDILEDLITFMQAAGGPDAWEAYQHSFRTPPTFHLD
jgi:hypothetical protein